MVEVQKVPVRPNRPRPRVLRPPGADVVGSEIGAVGDAEGEAGVSVVMVATVAC